MKLSLPSPRSETFWLILLFLILPLVAFVVAIVVPMLVRGR